MIRCQNGRRSFLPAGSNVVQITEIVVLVVVVVVVVIVVQTWTVLQL